MTVLGPVGFCDHGDKCDDIRLGPSLHEAEPFTFGRLLGHENISRGRAKCAPLSPAAFDTRIACEPYLPTAHLVAHPVLSLSSCTQGHRILSVGRFLLASTDRYNYLIISPGRPGFTSVTSFHPQHQSLAVTDNVYRLTQRHASYAAV